MSRGTAEAVDAFLDTTGTSSYRLQASITAQPAEAASGRRTECDGSQQQSDGTKRIAQALRAIAEDERRRAFVEGWYELLPGRGTPPELPAHGYPNPPLPVTVRSFAWKEIRRRANRAREIWTRRADSISSCGEQVVHLRCQRCGHVWSAPDPCASRFCPKCVRQVRRRNIAKIEDVVRALPGRRRFLSLTLRSNHDLEAMLRHLQRSLVRLRARTWWRDRVTAGICAVEVTHRFGKGWHAHAHLILWGKFLSRPQLISEWQAATGCLCPRPRRVRDAERPVLCCHSTFKDEKGEFQRADTAGSECAGCQVEPTGVDIRAARANVVAELCKYVGKDLGSGGGFLLDPDLAKEFLRVMWGRRMWTTFGAAFAMERPQTDQATQACAKCGGEEIEVLDRTAALPP